MVVAQAPILTSSSNPIVNDWHVNRYVDTFDVGFAGSALTWNLDTLHTTGSDTTFFSECSVSPHCAKFPGTTVYVHNSSDTDGTYLNTSPTALSYLGSYSDTEVVYSNHEDQLRYPFTFSNMFTDTFSSIFTTKTGYTYLRRGRIQVKGDAWGTLILPSGTYANTLRVWSIEDYDDSVMGPASPYVWHYNSETFTWYLPDQHTELLNQYKVYLNSAIFNWYSYYTQYGTTAFAGVNKPDTDIQLYPNPANEQVTIHSGELFNTGSLAELYTIDGRLAGKYQLTGNDTTIALGHLSPGMYMCRFYSPGREVQVKKLMVVR